MFSALLTAVDALGLQPLLPTAALELPLLLPMAALGLLLLLLRRLLILPLLLLPLLLLRLLRPLPRRRGLLSLVKLLLLTAGEAAVVATAAAATPGVTSRGDLRAAPASGTAITGPHRLLRLVLVLSQQVVSSFWPVCVNGVTMRGLPTTLLPRRGGRRPARARLAAAAADMLLQLPLLPWLLPPALLLRVRERPGVTSPASALDALKGLLTAAALTPAGVREPVAPAGLTGGATCC